MGNFSKSKQNYRWKSANSRFGDSRIVSSTIGIFKASCRGHGFGVDVSTHVYVHVFIADFLYFPVSLNAEM